MPSKKWTKKKIYMVRPGGCARWLQCELRHPMTCHWPRGFRRQSPDPPCQPKIGGGLWGIEKKGSTTLEDWVQLRRKEEAPSQCALYSRRPISWNDWPVVAAAGRRRVLNPTTIFYDFHRLKEFPPTPPQMRENHQGRRRLLLHRRLSSRDDGSRERERSADFYPPLTFLISSFHPPPRQTSSSSFTSLLFQPYQSILGLSYAASRLLRGAAPTHISLLHQLLM